MSLSKYTLRQEPKQKFGEEDDLWLSSQNNRRRMSKTNEKFACLKCHQVFKSKNKLSAHEQTCLKVRGTEEHIFIPLML